jgi:hypothetical protein
MNKREKKRERKRDKTIPYELDLTLPIITVAKRQKENTSHIKYYKITKVTSIEHIVILYTSAVSLTSVALAAATVCKELTNQS